ncbi:MAG: foldase protein PrsA [Prolixibacteraceae bacterium]
MKLNKIILTGIVFFLAFFVADTAFSQDKVVDQIVAVVGGNIILKSDIEQMYMDQQARGMTSDGDMKCEILEEYLIDKLLIAEAELDTNIQVTDSQINQQMDGQLQMYVAHFGSEKAVEDYFGKPISEIKSEMQGAIKSQLLSSQMKQTIISDVTATPSEVRHYYRNLGEEDIPVIPTQYEYAQITIKPEIELEEENRVKQELRKLKDRIENGSNFAAMAVIYSEGPSAKDGGELGYLGRAQLDPAYAAAAFNLKGGRVSNVVESEFGYHIIQLIDKKGEKINTRHILMRPKASVEAREQAHERLDSLATLIRKEKIGFKEAAMRFSSDESTRTNGGVAINPSTMSSKFTVEQLEPDVSKELAKLKIGEISEPFQTIDQESKQAVFKIIKLVDKIEGHKANLQNDYQLLAEQFLMKKQEKVLEEWVNSKQSNTYIRIDETFANCNFNFENWKK